MSEQSINNKIKNGGMNKKSSSLCSCMYTPKKQDRTHEIIRGVLLDTEREKSSFNLIKSAIDDPIRIEKDANKN